MKPRMPRKAKKALKSEGWKGTLFPRPTRRNRRFLDAACRAIMASVATSQEPQL